MPATIGEIRRKLRQLNPTTAGLDGEEYARKWMTSEGWKFIDVNQDKGKLAKALKAARGKRPDFLTEEPDGTIIALDAKHMKVGNPPTFRMKLEEIEKYVNLCEFIESEGQCKADILFMLIPKESDGTKITFIGLADFSDSTYCQILGDQARCIDLSDRLNDPELTFVIP